MVSPRLTLFTQGAIYHITRGNGPLKTVSFRRTAISAVHETWLEGRVSQLRNVVFYSRQRSLLGIHLVVPLELRYTWNPTFWKPPSTRCGRWNSPTTNGTEPSYRVSAAGCNNFLTRVPSANPNTRRICVMNHLKSRQQG